MDYPSIVNTGELEDPIGEYSVASQENANRYPGPTGFFSYYLERAMSGIESSSLPSELKRARKIGLIYVHKLPYSLYIPYCTGHSLQRLLKKGLRTPTIAARPARHLDSFFDHVANYLVTMQHYFSGAQAFSAAELYAGPFIRREGRNQRYLEQQVQRLVYNLNFPSRAGMQTPFTNLTIQLDASRRALDEERAVYGGEDESQLGAYLEEGKKFVVALSNVLREGDARGQPFTFPIPTLMTTSRILYDDPELFEAVFGTASRKGSFYWLNTRVVNPDASYAMCCRISIDLRELSLAGVPLSPEGPPTQLERMRFGGLWAVPDVTGSVEVITLNLPRLAIESGGDDSRFLELLYFTLEVVRLGGDWFRSRLSSLIGRYPHIYSMILDYLSEFPATHFNTVGILGLPEAAAIVEGEPRLWLEGSRSDFLRAADWMRRVVDHVVEVVRGWAASTGIPWNVEEVPGESAAARLAQRDALLHPDILNYLPDPDDPVYSTSVAPYYGQLTLPERIEVEARVQKSFTGGVMMHIFLGEEPDPEALAKFTRRLSETDLVYWSFTPVVTVCETCGKSFTGAYRKCPHCSSRHVELWSRIVGYYRPLSNWSRPRRREFSLRVHYAI
ncbi:MAG: anaerobic ribonucleoside-triphosphate reductase [Thermoproteota archaeon]|nr:MAG: anaerobic ribonucleoside-triphosphate reductase [Candidatus Korarchaeota archaeon]